MSKPPLVLLGDVLRQDTRYVHALEARQYLKLSVRLYGRGVVLDSSADGGTVKMQKHQFACPGQVILSEIWAKKGAIGIVPPEGDGALCTSHFFLFDIDEAKALPEFIAWLLRGNYFEPQLNTEARGTTGYAAIRPKQFLATSIPLPPLDEQRRIVMRVEELAAKVEEARGLRRQSVEECPLVIDAFLRKCFERLAKDHTPCNLDTVLDDAAYGTSEKSYADRAQNSTPVLRIPNVASEKLKLDDMKYTQLSPKVIESLTLRDGDILIVRTNGSIDLVGRCAVVRCLQECTVYASYLIRLRFNTSKLVPEFAQIGLRHLRRSGALVDLARTTAGQYNVSLGRLRGAALPIPPLPTQYRVVAELDALQAKVDSIKTLQTETAAELDAMLPAILDKAFKGEL
jgi:type I restriction enzyme S subunit